MSYAELPAEPDVFAPDGAAVRVLVECRGASMAHFSLAPHQVSVAVAHRTLEEMWYFVGGAGEMWRRSGRTGAGEVVSVRAGVALTIPAGTHFQFRSFGDVPLAAVAATVPAWPGIGDPTGRGEVEFVDGRWEPTVESGLAD